MQKQIQSCHKYICTTKSRSLFLGLGDAVTYGTISATYALLPDRMGILPSLWWERSEHKVLDIIDYVQIKSIFATCPQNISVFDIFSGVCGKKEPFSKFFSGT